MDESSANQAVVMSALTVSGIYFWRKLASPALPPRSGNRGTNLAQVPLSEFLVGFGFVFTALAMLSAVSAELAGALAILLAVAAILTNGVMLMADLNGRLS